MFSMTVDINCMRDMMNRYDAIWLSYMIWYDACDWLYGYDMIWVDAHDWQHGYVMI